MRAVMRSCSMLKCGEDYPLHNCIALAIGVYAVFRECCLQSAVLSGKRCIEVDEFAVVMSCEAFDAAVHIADRLDGLYLLAPRIAGCREDSAEDNIYILLLGHLCHCLYILHYQAIRNISLVLRDVVCAAADNYAVRISSDNILLKARDHLCCYLTALTAIYKVVFCKELGVSAVLCAIPTIENRIAHKYSAWLGVND